MRLMNIFKTFEIFLKEPLSVLKNNFFQIVSVQTPNIDEKSSVNVSVMKDKTQITIVNNEKMYNLLSIANYKARKRQEASKENKIETT